MQGMLIATEKVVANPKPMPRPTRYCLQQLAASGATYFATARYVLPSFNSINNNYFTYCIILESDGDELHPQESKIVYVVCAWPPFFPSLSRLHAVVAMAQGPNFSLQQSAKDK